PPGEILLGIRRSWVNSGKNLQALLEAVGSKCFVTLPVVERVIGVKPVALGINVEIGHFRRVRRLDEHLLLWNQAGNQLDLVVVEVEVLLVELPIHVGIGQENLGDAALKNYVEDLRLAQLIDRLCREHERRVVLSPGLEGFNDVRTDARVLQENPGLINEEGLEHVTDLWIADDRIGSMQNVEEQWLQHLRVFPHSLKIEALETRETDVVLRVVKEEP